MSSNQLRSFKFTYFQKPFGFRERDNVVFSTVNQQRWHSASPHVFLGRNEVVAAQSGHQATNAHVLQPGGDWEDPASECTCSNS